MRYHTGFTGFIVFMLVLSGMLPGCGFRLAGGGDSSGSLESISVYGTDSSRELVRFTQEYLKSSQVNVVEPDQAAAVLAILSEEVKKEVLALDRDGKAREYDLVLNMTFDVKRPDNSYLLTEQSIGLSRVFVFNKRDVLGSAEEERQLLHEMRKAAAKLIVRRVRAITFE